MPNKKAVVKKTTQKPDDSVSEMNLSGYNPTHIIVDEWKEKVCFDEKYQVCTLCKKYIDEKCMSARNTQTEKEKYIPNGCPNFREKE